MPLSLDCIIEAYAKDNKNTIVEDVRAHRKAVNLFQYDPSNEISDNLLYTSLYLAGFTLLKDEYGFGMRVQILSKNVGLRLVSREELINLPNHEFVYHVIRLKNRDASELFGSLRGLIQLSGLLIADRKENALVVASTVVGVRRILQIVDSLDMKK